MRVANDSPEDELVKEESRRAALRVMVESLQKELNDGTKMLEASTARIQSLCSHNEKDRKFEHSSMIDEGATVYCGRCGQIFKRG